MNILNQVVERHFMRRLGDVVPLYLDIQQIKVFVREDVVDEDRRKKLESKQHDLEEYLGTLDDI